VTAQPCVPSQGREHHREGQYGSHHAPYGFHGGHNMLGAGASGGMHGGEARSGLGPMSHGRGGPGSGPGAHPRVHTSAGGGGGGGPYGGGLHGGGLSMGGGTSSASEGDGGDDFRSPPKVLRLVSWVESIILHQGGRVIGANLGSALASSNGSLYKAIKGTQGGQGGRGKGEGGRRNEDPGLLSAG
jgi:hypothetical protein